MLTAHAAGIGLAFGFSGSTPFWRALVMVAALFSMSMDPFSMSMDKSQLLGCACSVFGAAEMLLRVLRRRSWLWFVWSGWVENALLGPIVIVAVDAVWLMIEILHDFIYQDIPKTLGILVV